MLSSHPLFRLIARAAWGWRAVLGVAILVLGGFLVINPLASLDALALFLGASLVALGLGHLSDPDDTRVTRLLGLAVGLALVLAGSLALLLPDHLVVALPGLLIGYLLISAGLHVWQARRGALDRRVGALLIGATQLTLAVLALTWGDLTLLTAAVFFGISLVLTGLQMATDAVLHRDRPRIEDLAASTPAPAPRRWGRVLALAVALVVSVAAVKVSDALDEAAPAVDDFYTAPASVPDAPGSLLRAEPFTREVPSGARGWRILYTTRDALGAPALASALVVAPERVAGPLPVIAWAHGTTGYARHCAPSLLEQPFTSGAFPDVWDQVVANGWAVVATDYAGLGTEGHQPYLIGKGQARSLLDSVRAARHLKDTEPTLGLAPDRTVVWGHSQGGAAALWTSQEQPTFAPDVPLLGTVAMAPAADPLALAKNLSSITGGSVFGSFVAQAYADTYPDLALSDMIRPAALSFVRELATRCLAEPGVLKSALTALSLGDATILRGDPSAGPFGTRLRQNIPTSPGPGPLLIAQGTDDSLVLPSVTRSYVRGLLRAGHRAELRTYRGLDHMPLVQEGSALLPELLAWTKARIDAAPDTDG